MVSCVAVAIDLARRTFTHIRANLVWSFVYNALAIPLATGMLYAGGAGITLPPSLAGISELISSVPVVLFSLILQLYTPPPLHN